MTTRLYLIAGFLFSAVLVVVFVALFLHIFTFDFTILIVPAIIAIIIHHFILFKLKSLRCFSET